MTEQHTDTLEAELEAFIVEEISLDPDAPMDHDTDLLLTGLVDSLGVVQIVAWLEDRFSVSIDPVDVVLDNFATVRRMAEFGRRLEADGQ